MGSATTTLTRRGNQPQDKNCISSGIDISQGSQTVRFPVRAKKAKGCLHAPIRLGGFKVGCHEMVPSRPAESLPAWPKAEW